MQQSEWDMAHVKHLEGVVLEATQQLGSALPNIYIIRFEKFKNPHTPDVEGYASKHFSEWNKDVFFKRRLSCSGKGAEGQYEFQAIEEYVKNKNAAAATQSKDGQKPYKVQDMCLQRSKCYGSLYLKTCCWIMPGVDVKYKKFVEAVVWLKSPAEGQFKQLGYDCIITSQLLEALAESDSEFKKLELRVSRAPTVRLSG